MLCVHTLILKLTTLDTLSKFIYQAYFETIQSYHLILLISKIRNPLFFVTNVTKQSVILLNYNKLVSGIDTETSFPYP